MTTFTTAASHENETAAGTWAYGRHLPNYCNQNEAPILLSGRIGKVAHAMDTTDDTHDQSVRDGTLPVRYSRTNTAMF